jgi:hypothetical protein
MVDQLMQGSIWYVLTPRKDINLKEVIELEREMDRLIWASQMAFFKAMSRWYNSNQIQEGRLHRSY